MEAFRVSGKGKDWKDAIKKALNTPPPKEKPKPLKDKKKAQ